MRTFLGIALLGLALGPSPGARASEGSRWVSLYSGRETSFSKHDRARLLTILTALGIEHQTDEGRHQILVFDDERSIAQDLVAKVMRHE